MPDWVYGTPIYYDQFKSTLVGAIMDDDDPEPDENEICKQMALQAMRAKGEAEEQANLRANALKEDFGTGVCTRVIVYNALGVPVTFRSKHDDNGYWSANSLPDRIEVGQWAVGLHRKTSGAASGSCGIVGYDLQGYGKDEVLMIGFNTPWGSSSASALCQVMDKNKWSNASWDSLMDKVYDSNLKARKDYGRARIYYETQNVTSPILEVLLTRSDIGY